MPRIGLALSGGGFRATLYHLGVIRFLRDAGQLKEVTDIASVSGGSVLAAHLTLNWDRYNGDDAAFAEAAEEVIHFVQFDIRNRIARRLPFLFPMRLLAKLARRNPRRFTPNALLATYYRRYLYGDRCLHELPSNPRLHMLATHISNGAMAIFNRDGLFVQQRRRNGQIEYDHVHGQMATIPRVVGASSAFPGFFPPVEFTAADLGVPEGQFPAESFTDGGVYDNLGTRAFSWLKKEGTEVDTVLVSDAGKPFQVLTNSALSFVGQSLRASDILWDRVWQLEKDSFGNREGFHFLPITQRVTKEEDPTATHPVIQTEVQTVRTDLDRFSTAEVNALVQHGYQVARSKCRNLMELDEATLSTPPWTPVVGSESPGVDAESSSGHETSQVTRLARKLRRSSGRRVWSTLLDWRDWTSYVYVVLAIIALVIPIRVYDLYRTSQIQHTVIESIARGEPDIRRILDIVNKNPIEDLVTVPINEAETATEVSYEGIEVVSHSRIIDLRNWRPEAEDIEDKGLLYISDRLSVRFQDSYKGDKIVTIRLPLPVDTVEFGMSRSEFKGTITRVSEPMIHMGQKRKLYEAQFDLTDLTKGEAAELELEIVASLNATTNTTRFYSEFKTDLVTVWMLFPASRPYRTYNLLRYPLDKSSPPEIVDSRFTIDHPYGSLIGWSVVNPELDSIYECRWEYE